MPQKAQPAFSFGSYETYSPNLLFHIYLKKNSRVSCVKSYLQLRLIGFSLSPILDHLK